MSSKYTMYKLASTRNRCYLVRKNHGEYSASDSSSAYNFGVKRVIHITLMKLMLITNIQYKEVGNVSQLLLKCINPSNKDLYSSSSDTEFPKH